MDVELDYKENWVEELMPQVKLSHMKQLWNHVLFISVSADKLLARELPACLDT